MKQTLMIMLLGMVLAAPANAHLVSSSQDCKTLTCVEASQSKNLSHVTYVCNNGAHRNKRWSCKAERWLTREHNKTLAALAPPPPPTRTLQSSSGSSLCGSSCVSCESGGDPTVWDKATGKTYWGKYQFDLGTWIAHGGSRESWGSASGYEQDVVASRVRYDAWPNC